MKIAVQQIEPDIVRAVRLVVDDPSKATHPIYDVSRGLGTGKATCRACNQPIKENARTILFWHAPHDPDHEHHYRRTRMVIHEDDCSGQSQTSQTVKCICGEQIPQNQWKTHIQTHNLGAGWIKGPLQPKKEKAASLTVCAAHSLAHCGQCEEDRELEEPHLDKRIPTIKKKKVEACIPCANMIADMIGSGVSALQGAGTGNVEHDTESSLHQLISDPSNPLGYAVLKGKQLLKKFKGSTEWNHTEEDGFEMWETKEKHNKFAIIETDDKFDLYELQGSFDSPEEAQAAADGMTRTAQDSGGGGGDGGSSGGSAGTGASSSGDGGMSTSGESVDSSDNESSEADITDGKDDEAPQSPNRSKECPKCKIPLEQRELLGNIKGYVCNSCGYVARQRRKKKIKGSWIDNLSDVQSLTSNEEKELEQLEITPQLPPSLLPSSELKYESKPASDLFIASKVARSVVCARCNRTYRVNKKGHFTGFCERCKEQLGMVTHKWDSEDAKKGHDG